VPTYSFALDGPAAGPIPVEISKLQNLKQLMLANNKLEGCIIYMQSKLM
jgi:hypothetical protein